MADYFDVDPAGAYDPPAACPQCAKPWPAALEEPPPGWPFCSDACREAHRAEERAADAALAAALRETCDAWPGVPPGKIR
jgi:hypothetical protein